MIIIPQEGLDILSSKSFAHLATIGPNGEPQSSPVWFDGDGTYVRISQTKTRQKYRNVQRHPHVALSILDPNNPYHSGTLRGPASCKVSEAHALCQQVDDTQAVPQGLLLLVALWVVGGQRDSSELETGCDRTHDLFHLWQRQTASDRLIHPPRMKLRLDRGQIATHLHIL